MIASGSGRTFCGKTKLGRQAATAHRAFRRQAARGGMVMAGIFCHQQSHWTLGALLRSTRRFRGNGVSRGGASSNENNSSGRLSARRHGQ